MRLEGISKALDRRMIAGLLKLEEKLKQEWSELLLQEEMLWLQKSRIEWLKFGD